MLRTALSQYGEKEIVGKENNKTIVDYAKEAGFNWVGDDETPWCSIFMNWVAMKAGYEYTGKANARSWLKAGIERDNPKMGYIVVFKRGNSTWQGHVGIFIREDNGFVYCLGGNQSNQVKISAYKKSDVLGYRQLYRV